MKQTAAKPADNVAPGPAGPREQSYESGAVGRGWQPVWRHVSRPILHAALVAGSILFSVPFIWLLSTSGKVPDEIFPPKWVPQIPVAVVDSPYVALRDNEYPMKPTLVSQEDWDRLYEPIKTGIQDKVASLAPELPEMFGPYLRHEALAQGIFSRLVKRTPDELFEKVEDVAVSWFSQNVDAELVRTVFETVYRHVALSNMAIHGWDVITSEYLPGEDFRPWKVVDGEADIVERPQGLARPSQEVHYSFENRDHFTVQAVAPLTMPFDNLKKVVVGNRGDRSWHEIWATLEFDGKKYMAADPAFTGVDKWQETTWQLASPMDDSIETKTWLRLDPAGASDFKEPGKIRLTLDYRQSSHAVAAWNKYTFNYREVLRMVPVMVYVKNSMILVALTIIGQVVASSLVAFAFARLTWPAREVWFVLVLATLMIPPQVTMIPVFLIFKWLGWYNTLKPLWIGAFFGSAFYIFLLRQFMKGIPKDLEDSAKIDGCGYFGIYRLIILPLIKPALATIAIFTFMATWNDFMGPLIYLSDQEKYPLSLGLFSLQTFQSNNFGLMMAASVMMTLPVIFLFFAAQRQFIQGITLTGLKG